MRRYKVDVLREATEMRVGLGRPLRTEDFKKLRETDKDALGLHHIYDHFKGGINELNKEIDKELAGIPQQASFSF